jgi:hypothetical protein
LRKIPRWDHKSQIRVLIIPLLHVLMHQPQKYSEIARPPDATKSELEVNFCRWFSKGSVV